MNRMQQCQRQLHKSGSKTVWVEQNWYGLNTVQEAFNTIIKAAAAKNILYTTVFLRESWEAEHTTKNTC